MIKTEVNLYILLLNRQTAEYQIVSLDNHIPIIPKSELNSSTSDLHTVLYTMFERYVDLSSSFIDFKLSDAMIINGTLNLIYYCLVSHSTKLKQSFLINSISYAPYIPNLTKILNTL